MNKITDFDNDEETFDHRYIFLVRQNFDVPPHVDSYYKLKTPDGINSDQFQFIKKIKDGFLEQEIQSDGEKLRLFTLRMRFNQDIYQHICLVKSSVPLTIEELNNIIESKYNDNTLDEFLKNASIRNS